ncbi:MAG: polyketide synthase [Bacteroidota bacterium]
MKRLDAAIAAGDHIYGVIKGWGVNQDGSTNGITAPSKKSQVKLQSDIYARFGLDPGTITYVEAHGTGTQLGDPIEVAALTESFRRHTEKRRYCGLGSVKSNIGHTLTAAGVSGLMKVLLQLQHRQLVPTIHYEKLNEHIDLEDSPFYINTELKDWETEDGQPRRAAVSSFGFSGTNAHIVIEEYREESKHKNVELEPEGPFIVPLSAKNEVRLKELVRNLSDYLDRLSLIDHLLLPDLAYTLQVGREVMETRLALVVNDLEELKTQLASYQKGKRKDLLIGNITKDQSDFLLEGGAGQAYINYAIENKELKSLAQLWVKGVEIDWNLLYKEGHKPNKMSLPTYPFARERYWYDSFSSVSEGTKKELTLIMNSTKEASWKESSFDYLSDHLVGEEIQLKTTQEGIAIVQLNARSTKNMLDEVLVKSLQKTFLDLRKMQDLKAVILTGYEEVFCMGGSQQMLEQIAKKESRFTDAPFLYRGLLEFDVPVISAIQGHAFGGGLLFGLYADIVLMNESGTYTANFMKYGFTPGMGATYILGEKLGKQLGLEMMYTARLFSGEELKRRGASVLIVGEVLKEALQIARELSSKPRKSLETLKKHLSQEVLSELLIHISGEEQMHEETFPTEEVKHRISEHFVKASGFSAEEAQGALAPEPSKVHLPDVSQSVVKKQDDVHDSIVLATPSSEATSLAGEREVELVGVPAGTQTQSVESQKQIDQQTTVMTRDQIIAKLKSIFEQVIHIPSSALDEQTSFADLGVDSISGVELIRSINETFSLSLEAAMLYDYQNLNELAGLIIKKSGWLENQLDDLQFLISESTEESTADNYEKREWIKQENEIERSALSVDDLLSSFDEQRVDSIAKKKEESKKTPAEPIAIIGYYGLFHEVQNAEELWTGGLTQLDETKPRSNGSYLKLDLPDEKTVETIFEVLAIDRDAYHTMGHQQQVVFYALAQAIQHAGLSKKALKGSPTGVFVTAGQLSELDGTNSNKAEDHAAHMIPARISFELDLKGPSEIHNASCTSSYLLIHKAIQSMLLGECDQALVIGINLITEKTADYGGATDLQALLSNTGVMKSFDATADGIVRSEGVGVVLLKKKAEAEGDQNKIYGLVRGTSFVHGGKNLSWEAPNPKGLKTAITSSIEKSGVEVDTIDYIEAHGIANPMADAIELSAISEAYRNHSKASDKQWYVGSVKPVVGHPELASGMASLIKVLKAFEHQMIPGIAGLGEVTKELASDHSLILPKAPVAWESDVHPRRAALNSYAVGGVNAHIILEEYLGNGTVPHSPKKTGVEALPGLINAETPDMESPSLGSAADRMDNEQRARLKDLIAEALHILLSEINDSTPLTDYGISSLQMVQLVQSIHLQLGVRMTFGEVIQAETAGDLIDLISNKVKSTGILAAEATLDEHIILFKKTSEGETGIILPGMPGIVDGYFELAEGIAEPTAYGIQMVGFDGKAEPLSSVPSMASHYAEMIQVNAKGKISLYAHSYGGLILFELLKILKASETQVDGIFLLDSYAHVLTKMNQTEKHAFFLYLIGAQLQLSMDKKEAQTFSKKLIRQPKHKRAGLVYTYLTEKGVVIAKDFFERLYQIYNISMLINYRPKGKLDYEVRLIKAANPLVENEDPTLGWSRYYRSVKVIESEGDHFEVVKKPFVREWMEKVKLMN